MSATFPLCLFPPENGNCSDVSAFLPIRVSFFVGVPVLLFLLVAVVVLFVVVVCACLKLRTAKRNIRTIKIPTTDAVEEDELEPSDDNVGLDDSFESIDAIVENNKRDTVVNNSYDLVKLNKDEDIGETSRDAEKHEYTNVNRKKKTSKNKRSSSNKQDLEGEIDEKDDRYNKLVRGSDPLQQLGIDMDSYSALDKPKKTESEGNSDTKVSKVKELPPIPSQKKDQPQAGSSGKAPVLVPKKDAEGPYQEIAKPKEEVKNGSEMPESVYYNDTVVVLTKLVEEAKIIESATEKEKRLNIYSQSISLNEF